MKNVAGTREYYRFLMVLAKLGLVEDDESDNDSWYCCEDCDNWSSWIDWDEDEDE